MRIKSLSRVFQAFRIAVNDELNVLDKTITNIVPVLAPGGRLVIISYHSLEDRIVKNIFNRFAGPKKHVNKYAKVVEIPEYELVNKKPIIPSDDEIERNPRARSAKLRVIQKN